MFLSEVNYKKESVLVKVGVQLHLLDFRLFFKDKPIMDIRYYGLLIVQQYKGYNLNKVCH